MKGKKESRVGKDSVQPLSAKDKNGLAWKGHTGSSMARHILRMDFRGWKQPTSPGAKEVQGGRGRGKGRMNKRDGVGRWVVGLLGLGQAEVTWNCSSHDKDFDRQKHSVLVTLKLL